MVAKAAAAALLALVCLAAAVQGQPIDNTADSMFPSGMDDINAQINAMSRQPGAVVASSTAISGQPVQTFTSGTGPNGQAMATGSVTDANGRTRTSTTINGVTTTTSSTGSGSTMVSGSASSSNSNRARTSTTINGVTTTTNSVGGGSTYVSSSSTSSSNSGVGLCSSVSQTNTKVCDGPGGACCSVSSSVKRCKTYVDATTKVNGLSSRCCVTLLRTKDKSPALWCTGPSSKAYYSIPPTASVVLKPSCSSNVAKSTAGSSACIVTFPTMPKGFMSPVGYTPAKPLLFNKMKGFQPCMSSYSRVIQVDNIGKRKEAILTSKCE